MTAPHVSLAGMLFISAMLAVPEMAAAQIRVRWFADRVRVINVIPANQSGEVTQNAEANIAVNPLDGSQIVVSAFVNSGDVCGATSNLAPVYVTTDGGTNWTASCIVPTGPSASGLDLGTGDISIDYARTTGQLYGGILRQDVGFRMNILRTNAPLGPAAMANIATRDLIDQPWIRATSGGSGNVTDRLYVGNNDLNLSQYFTPGASGRSATIDQSLDAAIAAPAFALSRLEVRNTVGQDGPPIRMAAHGDGTVYAAFFRWTAFTGSSSTADVVVTRDDAWGSTAPVFSSLNDPGAPTGDGLVGVRVAATRTIPWGTTPGLGNERVGADLSIAVDPHNSSTVYLAWADRVSTTDYSVHLRRSTDRGQTWSTDLRTVTNAKNPGVAINSNGVVAFLYQEVTGTSPNRRWTTKVEISSNGFSSRRTHTLADVNAEAPAPAYYPYIGDYVDVVANGTMFHGAFAANNQPILANFPRGVTYLRNVDFTTNRLMNATGGTVATSIDPFYFSVTPWRWSNLCDLAPLLCQPVKIERGIIQLQCIVRDCRIFDPIPKNCLLKFSCPPCRAGLCPPFYHIRLDGLADVWDVDLYDPRGEPFAHERIRLRDGGTVISFRPRTEDHKEGSIGDYTLVFSMRPNARLRRVYPVRSRLDVSDRHYGQPQR